MGWGWDDLLSIPTGGIYSAVKQGGGKLYDSFYKKPADAKMAGLDQLSQGLNSLADQQKQFQLQGMNQALGQYGRANAVNQSLYGDPASLKTAKYTPSDFVKR
jgi:hypothetical protein